MNDSFIVCSSLRKAFRSEAEELVILDGIDLAVERGQTVAITGQSGSGKSTLLNIIGGLDTLSSGDLSVGGMSISLMSDRDLDHYRGKLVGFVFQFHYLLKDFTSLENVMLPSLMIDISRHAAKSRALDLIKAVGLSDRKHHYPAQLSGGERQRLALARAMMNDPDLILADEPTGNLDPKNALVAEDLLFNLVREYGKTLLIVTHDARFASRADRTCELSRGSLLEV